MNGPDRLRETAYAPAEPNGADETDAARSRIASKKTTAPRWERAGGRLHHAAFAECCQSLGVGGSEPWQAGHDDYPRALLSRHILMWS